MSNTKTNDSFIFIDIKSIVYDAEDEVVIWFVGVFVVIKIAVVAVDDGVIYYLRRIGITWYAAGFYGIAKIIP